MTDLPFQRPPDLQGRIDALHDALDKSAARREELCDERLRRNHQFRCIHHDRGDGCCSEDGQTLPCRSLQVIDGEVA
jgi:hypothetical protein